MECQELQTIIQKIKIYHFKNKIMTPFQQDLFTGTELRDRGIEKAINHANGELENWSEEAYGFLKNFIEASKQSHVNTFMTEHARSESKYFNIPDPPSSRAWGGIILRAAREGLIRKVGFREVSNPKAHCTPATVWEIV